MGVTLKMWRYRHAAHYLVGILIAMSALVSWSLPFVGAALFVIYEIRQHKAIKDFAYLDILEAVIGFFVAVAGLVIWEVLL